MVVWAPHGPLYDEDLYPEFGMDVQQFLRRFTQLATSMESSALDPSDRELLEEARRLLTTIT
jgi:hypothetical protein